MKLPEGERLFCFASMSMTLEAEAEERRAILAKQKG